MTTRLSKGSIPLATRWLQDSVSEDDRAAIDSVYMIINPRENKKGTGFLLSTGYLVTNEHVVRNCSATDLRIVSSQGKSCVAHSLVLDETRDLAVIETDMTGGLTLSDVVPEVGVQVNTWGFPLGYNGPAPLLTVGHLAGFEAVPRSDGEADVRRLVVNAAFNGGNSGGPLFATGLDGVIGVVVSKHAPIPQFLATAIQALASNESGVVFTATDPKGGTTQFVESQLVAEVLHYFRDMTQVVIGEAIASSELIAVLEENHLPAAT